jgi:Bax protein
MMHFGKFEVHHWIAYTALGILAAILFLLFSYLGVTYHVKQYSTELSERDIQDPTFDPLIKGETADLINKLKFYGLWELSSTEEVPRFFIKAYPVDLNTVEDISVRKRVFLNTLLPHALYVRQEVLHRRGKFEAILDKIDCTTESLDFSIDLENENQCFWTGFLETEEVSFVQKLCEDYRTTSAEILLERVDAVPVSIILSQGALESFWGSSRFAREGNSIFGMWTWKTEGHKVKTYENVLESLQAYHLTLNRLEPYEEFRQLRRITDNPLILAEGLRHYSERGQDYVEDIKSVILSNSLERYDSYSLADHDLPEFTETTPGSTNLAEPNKVSL